MGKISEHQEKVKTALQVQNKVVKAILEYTQEISKSTLDLQMIIKNKEEKDRRETNLLLHNISRKSRTFCQIVGRECWSGRASQNGIWLAVEHHKGLYLVQPCF